MRTYFDACCFLLLLTLCFLFGKIYLI
jgi:hypothetical protein